eukprot:scaffold131271_cov18-Tisochrysis_lutea.AAC.1
MALHCTSLLHCMSCVPCFAVFKHLNAQRLDDAKGPRPALISLDCSSSTMGSTQVVGIPGEASLCSVSGVGARHRAGPATAALFGFDSPNIQGTSPSPSIESTGGRASSSWGNATSRLRRAAYAAAAAGAVDVKVGPELDISCAMAGHALCHFPAAKVLLGHVVSSLATNTGRPLRGSQFANPAGTEMYEMDCGVRDWMQEAFEAAEFVERVRRRVRRSMMLDCASGLKLAAQVHTACKGQKHSCPVQAITVALHFHGEMPDYRHVACCQFKPMCSPDLMQAGMDWWAFFLQPLNERRLSAFHMDFKLSTCSVVLIMECAPVSCLHCKSQMLCVLQACSELVQGRRTNGSQCTYYVLLAADQFCFFRYEVFVSNFNYYTYLLGRAISSGCEETLQQLTH